jgi:hypothetical protein
MKGTLLEGTGAPGSGTGGGWVAAPQVVPGVVDKLFQPLTLESLLLSGLATTNTVRYAIEGTAISAAAGVAEGGVKPESTLAFSTVDEPVKKVATTLTISEELLEDAPLIQQFVNNQLSAFVRIESERQLLRGTQGGNEVQGLLTSRNVPVYAGGTAAGNKAVQLFKAMNGMRGSAFLEPDWIVLHPTDYQDIRLLTDTAGQLFGGGPFQGPVRRRRQHVGLRPGDRGAGLALEQARLRQVGDRRCRNGTRPLDGGGAGVEPRRHAGRGDQQPREQLRAQPERDPGGTQARTLRLSQ